MATPIGGTNFPKPYLYICRGAQHYDMQNIARNRSTSGQTSGQSITEKNSRAEKRVVLNLKSLAPEIGFEPKTR